MEPTQNTPNTPNTNTPNTNTPNTNTPNTQNIPELNILELFEGNKISVSVNAIKTFGLEKAVFIHNLLKWWQYLKNKGQLQDDGSFFLYQKKMQDETGIHPDTQTKIIQYFESIGILNIKRKGVPPKNYYFINIIRLAEMCNYLKTAKSFFYRLLNPVKSGLYINNINNNKLDTSYLIYSTSGEVNSPEVEEKELSILHKDVSEVLDYCNNLGSPLKKHRTNTKIWAKSFEIIKKLLLKGESKESLISARSRFRDFMLKYKTATHITSDSLWNCSLPDFFEPSIFLKKFYLRCGFSIKSLYDEFKSEKHPEIKFAKIKSDNNPEITQKLSKCFFRTNELSPKDKNILIDASTKISELFNFLSSGKWFEIGIDNKLTSLIGFTNLIIDFAKNDPYWSSRLNPSVFVSDRFLYDSFISYLRSQGIVKDENEERKINASYSIYK